MQREYLGIYEAIIESTSSDLILFFVIIAVLMAVVVVPLYMSMLSDRKKQRIYEQERDERLRLYEKERDERLREHELKRDEAARQHERESKQQLINVIEKNSTVIAGLQTTLDNSGDSFVKSLDRVHRRLDEQGIDYKDLSSEISQVNTKMTNVLDNQREMASKLNRILITASGGKLPEDSKK